MGWLSKDDRLMIKEEEKNCLRGRYEKFLTKLAALNAIPVYRQ